MKIKKIRSVNDKKTDKQEKRHSKMPLFCYANYMKMKAEIRHIIYNITTNCSEVQSECIKNDEWNGNQGKEGMICEKEKCNSKTQAELYRRCEGKQGAVSADAAFHHYFPAVYLLSDVRSDYCV